MFHQNRTVADLMQNYVLTTQIGVLTDSVRVANFAQSEDDLIDNNVTDGSMKQPLRHDILLITSEYERPSSKF